MGAVTRGSAADGLDVSGVDTTFETEDGSSDPFFCEDVPIVDEEVLDLGAVLFRAISPSEVVAEFLSVLLFVIMQDICAGGGISAL